MNANLLRGELARNGYTQAETAAAVGLSLSRFNAKLNKYNGAEFSLGEVKAFKRLFNLSPEQIDDIFFN